MNKKAQINSLYLSIIVAFILFFMGSLMANFIITEVTTARLDNVCTSPTSDGGRLLCLVIDFTVPYFIIAVFSAAGGYAFSRFLT